MNEKADKKPYILTVTENSAGQRLDKFLALNLPDLSRSRIQALIEQNMVSCSGKIITGTANKTKLHEQYIITIPAPAESHIKAQNIAINIVYEDSDLLVINKQAGLTVHPAAGNRDNTLVNALLAYCGDTLSGIGGVARPGIVHRLDKDTSGLMVVAKNDKAHTRLSAQLADHTLGRTYNAVVWGEIRPASGTITGNIGRSPINRQKMAVVKNGGKHAVTHYKTLQNFSIASLVECRLETGRTHQIRVHLTHIGNPLIGDPVYGQSTKSRLNQKIYRNLPENIIAALHNFTRQALHASHIRFIHPSANKEMSFTCPLPPDMQDLLDTLKI